MTKMIALRDEAYEILAGFKHKGESFSDVVFRLGEVMKEGKKKRSVLEFAGAWKDMTDKEAKELLRMRHEPKDHDYW